MARRHRRDDAGAIHHIFNRGIAKRTMFESRQDKRMFLSLVARSVRRGELKVFAYCIMTTHFHLLVQSVTGRVDFAMQRIQTDYSRYFNRTRHRDGGLVRGRYASKRVESTRYFWAATVYIEANAQVAKMCRNGDEYEFSSAYALRDGAGPRWLDASHRNTAWAASRPRRELEKLADLVEARLAHAAEDDEIDGLVRSAPPHVLRWMMARADLADQTKVGLPVAHFDDVHECWLESLDAIRALPRPPRTAHKTNEQAMLCGLTFYLCGLRQRAIGDRIGHSTSSAGKLLSVFRHRLGACGEFGAAASEIATEAIRRGPFGVEDEEVVVGV